MIWKFLLSRMLWLSIVGLLFYWGTLVAAHEAFYPHHREDFAGMQRRRELRMTVLISTVIFVGVFTVVVYTVLRKSSSAHEANGMDMDAEVLAARVHDATYSGARAVEQVLAAGGSIGDAAAVGLTAYAETAGISWQLHPYRLHTDGAVPYQIRCRIGTDVVTLAISPEVIRVQAVHARSRIGIAASSASEAPSATVILQRPGNQVE